MTDLAKNICDAIDVIVAKRLGELKFDKTIYGVIIEQSNSETGEYKARYQDSVITVYASNPAISYVTGTLVAIRVPLNDLSNRKTIIEAATGQDYIDWANSINQYNGDLAAIQVIIDENAVAAQQAAREAEDAAKAYAQEQAEYAQVSAQVYADGIVSSEESARLEAAARDLQTAKEYANRKAEEALYTSEQLISVTRETAYAASKSADTANLLLSDIASDSKITASEKQLTLKEWQIIEGEYPGIGNSADNYNIAHAAYDTAYNNLNTYLNVGSPALLSDITTTSDIVGDTFRLTFKNYYDARQTLLNDIAEEARVIASAAAINIQASGLLFQRNSGGAITAPANIEFMLLRSASSAAPVYWTTTPMVALYNAPTGGSLVTQGVGGTNTDIVYMRASDFGSNVYCTIRATVPDEGLSDTTSINSIKDGFNAITVVAANDSYSAQATSAGVVASPVTGSGTTVQVYEGSSALTFVNALTAPSQFRITGVTVSPTSKITASTTYTGQGTATATIGNHSNFDSATDAVTITYALSVRRADGNDVTAQAIQVITKAKAGAQGPQGPTGATGPSGRSAVTLKSTGYFTMPDKLSANLVGSTANGTWPTPPAGGFQDNDIWIVTNFPYQDVNTITTYPYAGVPTNGRWKTYTYKSTPTPTWTTDDNSTTINGSIMAAESIVGESIVGSSITADKLAIGVMAPTINGIFCKNMNYNLSISNPATMQHTVTSGASTYALGLWVNSSENYVSQSFVVEQDGQIDSVSMYGIPTGAFLEAWLYKGTRTSISDDAIATSTGNVGTSATPTWVIINGGKFNQLNGPIYVKKGEVYSIKVICSLGQWTQYYKTGASSYAYGQGTLPGSPSRLSGDLLFKINMIETKVPSMGQLAYGGGTVTIPLTTSSSSTHDLSITNIVSNPTAYTLYTLYIDSLAYGSGPIESCVLAAQSGSVLSVPPANHTYTKIGTWNIPGTLAEGGSLSIISGGEFTEESLYASRIESPAIAVGNVNTPRVELSQLSNAVEFYSGFATLPDAMLASAVNGIELTGSINNMNLSDTGWIAATLKTTAGAGWTNYNALSANAPQFRKIGDTCFFRGIISPNSARVVNADQEICALPSADYIPSGHSRYFVAHGSGGSMWLLVVSTDGKVYAARYYSLDNTTPSLSTSEWMPFDVSWAV